MIKPWPKFLDEFEKEHPRGALESQAFTAVVGFGCLLLGIPFAAFGELLGSPYFEVGMVLTTCVLPGICFTTGFIGAWVYDKRMDKAYRHYLGFYSPGLLRRFLDTDPDASTKEVVAEVLATPAIMLE